MLDEGRTRTLTRDYPARRVGGFLPTDSGWERQSAPWAVPDTASVAYAAPIRQAPSVAGKWWCSIASCEEVDHRFALLQTMPTEGASDSPTVGLFGSSFTPPDGACYPNS